MKKFRFTLQPIHDLREMRRDEAERSHAQAIAAVTEANSRLDEAESTRREAAESLRSLLQHGQLDPHEVALRSSYLSSLIAREADARTRLAALEEERERRRHKMAEAARAAEATAKLRERQSARHFEALARYEQNQLDEMAVVTAARRNS